MFSLIQHFGQDHWQELCEAQEKRESIDRNSCQDEVGQIVTEKERLRALQDATDLPLVCIQLIVSYDPLVVSRRKSVCDNLSFIANREVEQRLEEIFGNKNNSDQQMLRYYNHWDPPTSSGSEEIIIERRQKKKKDHATRKQERQTREEERRMSEPKLFVSARFRQRDSDDVKGKCYDAMECTIPELANTLMSNTPFGQFLKLSAKHEKRAAMDRVISTRSIMQFLMKDKNLAKPKYVSSMSWFEDGVSPVSLLSKEALVKIRDEQERKRLQTQELQESEEEGSEEESSSHLYSGLSIMPPLPNLHINDVQKS